MGLALRTNTNRNELSIAYGKKTMLSVLLTSTFVLVYYGNAGNRTEVLTTLERNEREDSKNMDRNSMQRDRNGSQKQTPMNRDDAYDDDADGVDTSWPGRMPSSVRRYRSDVKLETGRTQADVQLLQKNDDGIPYSFRRRNIPARRTAKQPESQAAGKRSSQERETGDILSRHSGDLADEEARQGHRLHWLVYVGLAMLVMMVGWLVLSTVTSWWEVKLNDWQYGRPRTYQVDREVGHSDSQANPSHFIALNMNRRVEIIECPAGDCAKAKIYVGPVLIGQGQDLAPVTLDFKDVNGDGKVDMIVIVQDSRIVFINENGAFRPQRPGEVVK